MTEAQLYIIIFFIVFTILFIAFLIYSTKDYKEFIAGFDFTAEQDDELSFKKGNKIIMVRKIDDNWASGYNVNDPGNNNDGELLS